MAGMKGSNAYQTPKLDQIAVQTSSLGVSVGVVWGSNRASCNLIDSVNFQSHQQSQGGKGGGGKGSGQYTYTASILLSIVQGPIDGVRTIWRDQEVFRDGTINALSQANLSIALGARGQSVWGYLSSGYPTHALGYSETAYAYAADYDLGSSGAPPNHTFEVQRRRAVIGGVTNDDANPAEIIPDSLTSTYYGLPLWDPSWLGSYTDYSNYCLSAGILLSPYENASRARADFITEMMEVTNSDCVFSDGQLKIVPFGDVAISGNGATWTPNLTPAYDLDDRDFLVAHGADPVKISFTPAKDAFNDIKVEFLDRSISYNTNTAPARDQGNIDQFGRIRDTSPRAYHSICDAGVAGRVAQLILQRVCYVQAKYSFKLPETYCLLEPQADLLTLTTGDLDHVLVRITAITEAEDGDLTIEAEGVVLGAGSVVGTPRQGAGGGGVNHAVQPGLVAAPALFNAPTALTDGFNEVWVALAGVDPTVWGGCEVWVSVDGVNYELAHDSAGVPVRLIGPSRYGTTTASIGAGP